ncbi:MAG: DNA mismatch repair endonuclease MutL [Porcipelethomonas sp.]
MAEISLLSKDVSELIAAGEVIERPASVIKELLENSIDAGASHITVEIKNGGTTYMRITDDGCGIAPDQTATAFLRHATSKITSKGDLDSIMTLGFRGEALASISAVAKVEVLTKRREDELGTNYIIEGSAEKLNERTGCPDGTTIIIRDIFYNVPVRRKFMKRDSAEANAIVSIMQKIVLSHPEISFKLIKDNKVEFTSAGDGELYSAIYGVYGRDFAHDLIPVDYTENNISVKGFIMKPLYSKANRSFQNFFINGRFVRSVTCRVSLEEAYKNLVMTGKYPACVLMLELPPATVDVNIHPAKAEVRFSDERTVFDSVYFAVKNALMASGLIYEFQIKDERKPESYYKSKPFEPEQFSQPEIQDVREKLSPVPDRHTCIPEEKYVPKVKNTVPEPKHNRIITPVSESEFSIGEKTEPMSFSASKTLYNEAVQIVVEPEDVETEEDEEDFGEFSYISRSSFEKTEPEPQQPEKREEITVAGELLKNYIIAQSGDNMVIIDKHAAHERVIFEKLKSSCSSSDSQILMTKPEILLSEKECCAMSENMEKLEGMGFRIDASKPPFVKVLAVPVILQELDIDEMIPEIAENLCLNKVDPQTHMLDDMLHELACKAAIKANDKNSLPELKALAEEVFYNENIRHCPHGRPVMFMLPKRDIEKQFKRIL